MRIKTGLYEILGEAELEEKDMYAIQYVNLSKVLISDIEKALQDIRNAKETDPKIAGAISAKNYPSTSAGILKDGRVAVWLNELVLSEDPDTYITHDYNIVLRLPRAPQFIEINAPIFEENDDISFMAYYPDEFQEVLKELANDLRPYKSQLLKYLKD